MPRPDGTKQPWYSFNYGNVHVTLMSTEHDFTGMNRRRADCVCVLVACTLSSDVTWGCAMDNNSRLRAARLDPCRLGGH